MGKIKGTDATFDKLIATGSVLADFGAKWCGPCRMMETVMRTMADRHNIVTVDIDDCQELTAKYNIGVVPTFIAFKNGKETERTVGIKQQSDLEALLKK